MCRQSQHYNSPTNVARGHSSTMWHEAKVAKSKQRTIAKHLHDWFGKPITAEEKKDRMDTMKKKLNESQSTRDLTNDSAEYAVDDILCQNGIDPKVYHGKCLIGPQIQMLLAKRVKIMRELKAKCFWIRERTIAQSPAANIATVKEIDEEMEFFSSILQCYDSCFALLRRTRRVELQSAIDKTLRISTTCSSSDDALLRILTCSSSSKDTMVVGLADQSLAYWCHALGREASLSIWRPFLGYEPKTLPLSLTPGLGDDHGATPNVELGWRSTLEPPGVAA
jgi:hypothetical protein